MKKANIIRTTHKAIRYRFPRGNPAIVARPFAAARLSPRLAKLYAKIHKGGKAGVSVKRLDRDERWAARQLVEVGALRAVPNEEKSASKKAKALAKKPAGASNAVKVAAVTPTTGRP